MKNFILNNCNDWRVLSICCIFVIIVILSAYVLLQSKRIRISKNIDGSISLTKSAFKKVIEMVARELGIHGKICIKIRCCSGKYSIDVLIQIGDWQELGEITNALQERLKNVFTNDIGIADTIKVNVIVGGFLPQNEAGINYCAKSSLNGIEAKVKCSCDREDENCCCQIKDENIYTNS